MKFEVFAEKFFEKRKVLVLSKQLCSASLNSDQIRYQYVSEAIKRKELTKITTLDIDKYLDSLILEGKSPATRNRYRALLYTYFKYAVRSGNCKKNPVLDIPILSEKLKTRPVSYWPTCKERDRYIDAAFRFGAVFGIGGSILCLGGCRISEALVLKFNDIEWDRNYVRIRRTLERHSGDICQRTKGQRAGGEYQMILVPRLRKLLKKWQATALFRKTDDFILHSNKGQHFTYDQYASTHEKIIHRTELKRITLHDLRRTFASNAERVGFHKAEIGELLGHETLTATEAYTRMDVSHLIEKAKRVGFGG